MHGLDARSNKTVGGVPGGIRAPWFFAIGGVPTADVSRASGPPPMEAAAAPPTGQSQ